MPITVGCFPRQPECGWAIRNLSGDDPAVDHFDPPVSWSLDLWPVCKARYELDQAIRRSGIQLPEGALRH